MAQSHLVEWHRSLALSVYNLGRTLAFLAIPNPFPCTSIRIPKGLSGPIPSFHPTLISAIPPHPHFLVLLLQTKHLPDFTQGRRLRDAWVTLGPRLGHPRA